MASNDKPTLTAPEQVELMKELARIAKTLRDGDAQMVKRMYKIHRGEFADGREDREDSHLSAYHADSLRNWIAHLIRVVDEVDEPDEGMLVVAAMVALSRFALNTAHHDRKRFVALATAAVNEASKQAELDLEDAKADEKRRLEESAAEAARLRAYHNPQEN